jgi:ribosomal protein L16/L10AE
MGVKKLKKFVVVDGKKNHNKVRFVCKKFYEVVSTSHYLKLMNSFYNSPRKSRRYFSRALFRNKIELMPMSGLRNGFVNIFKYYGYACLVAQQYGKLTDYHLETLRRSIKKAVSKRCFIFRRAFPYMRLLKRVSLIRMGGGKGSRFDKVVYPVYPGCVILDVRGGRRRLLRDILLNISTKLPFKTKVVFLDNF